MSKGFPVHPELVEGWLRVFQRAARALETQNVSNLSPIPTSHRGERPAGAWGEAPISLGPPPTSSWVSP